MGRRSLERPAGAVERRTPPAHDRWQGHLATGMLTLRLTVPAEPPEQYVSPSTGRLGLIGDGAAEVVALRTARRGGVPVVPGSGIKGAVRTLYELLSFSCDPLARAGAGAGSADRCSPQSCCDACSVFGTLGYNGRVGFGDAVPAGPSAVAVTVEKVSVPWTPDASKTHGDFRLYDLEEARLVAPGRATAERRPKELAREVYRGAFDTRMTFANLEEQELGRLLLAMGMGSGGQARFYLRLGGVKYDGKGAAGVTAREVRLAWPRRAMLLGEEAEAQCATWIAAARASRWDDTFWPKLEELAAVLGPRA
jgi:RAMP superfamily